MQLRPFLREGFNNPYCTSQEISFWCLCVFRNWCRKPLSKSCVNLHISLAHSSNYSSEVCTHGLLLCMSLLMFSHDVSYLMSSQITDIGTMLFKICYVINNYYAPCCLPQAKQSCSSWHVKMLLTVEVPTFVATLDNRVKYWNCCYMFSLMSHFTFTLDHTLICLHMVSEHT